jgi:diguanylate cyclase (GGDEF)-like protein
LARAEEAEKLEQDRKEILELVANDQPLDVIIAAMADAVAGHLPGSLCSIRVDVSDDSHISIYPGFPEVLAVALEQVGITFINPTLASAAIDKLSDDARWLRFIQSSGQLPYRYYRAVPVTRSSRLAGMIVSLFVEDRPHESTEQTLLESWGRFASLAVERRGLYEQLSFRAQYDSLTSLLNRAALYDRVDSWIRANSTMHSPMAVVYLDLDGFKQINDTHGHGAGDRVLQHVAAQIVETVRRTDVVARLGGDEFVIVLPGASELSEARRVADLVAVAIAKPLAYGGRELRIGGCFGISLYPADGDSTEALLKIADEDMYRAKLKHRKLQASAANQSKVAAFTT